MGRRNRVKRKILASWCRCCFPIGAASSVCGVVCGFVLALWSFLLVPSLQCLWQCAILPLYSGVSSLPGVLFPIPLCLALPMAGRRRKLKPEASWDGGRVWPLARTVVLWVPLVSNGATGLSHPGLLPSTERCTESSRELSSRQPRVLL